MYIADEKRYEKTKYAFCGASGLQLPRVSLGIWHNFGTYDDYENMKKMCFTAFDNGITHFDAANNYGPVAGSAEINFGRILKEEMSNLHEENEGVNIILKQSNKKIPKDKFSAFEYGLYYIKQEEENTKKRRKFNAADWMFYK